MMVANRDLSFFTEKYPNRPVLIMFGADWCAPCQRMKPIADEAITELGGWPAAEYVNIEHNEQIVFEAGVRSVPTFLTLDGGKITASKSGAMTKDALKAFIRSGVSNG